MNTITSPTPAAERIHALDIIRGFALLGILLMNIEFFQRPLQAIMLGFNAEQSGLDYGVAWFSFAFIQGKFYTMFSLLFGLGFVIFLDRAMQRGVGARGLFARRLAVLLVFGVAHVFLVWSGDILHTYAMVGFLLLLFAHTPARRMWKWGLAFLLAPPALMWLGALGIHAAMQAPDGGAEMLAGFEADHAAVLADIARGEVVYATGTWWEAVQWRVHEWRSLYLGGGLFFFVPMILGMFLIGAAFGRARVFADVAGNQPLFRRMMLLGFGAGIPGAVVWGLYGPDMNMLVPTFYGAALFTLSVVVNLALCLAYIGTLMVLLHRGRTWLMRLAPVGRMALTNYLMHSVVLTLLFYGYGLGLYGEIGRAGATGMALLLYAGQVWFSGWWLARYRMGPMEWLWRTATYGRRQPLRLAVANNRA